MKTHLIIFGLVILLVVGCSPQQVIQGEVQNVAQDAVEKVALETKTAVKEKALEESQELVNFQCTIAGLQTFYFLKEKVKIVSPAGESWLNDDGYFTKVEMDGDVFLVQYPVEESEMNYADMKVTYEVSKKNEVYDCELDTVTEDIVTVPDLEVITPEDLANKMLAGFGQIGLS